MGLTGETCPIPKGKGLDVPDRVAACFRNPTNCERFTLTPRERRWRRQRIELVEAADGALADLADNGLVDSPAAVRLRAVLDRVRR